MKSLVIGYGSIGRRHAAVLENMGHDVALVTSVSDTGRPGFASPEEAVEKWSPDYVVIANDTRLHADSLAQLHDSGFDGVTLVEKPLFASAVELGPTPTGPVYVGYGLRFHPAIQRISALIGDEPLWTLTAYVGQYLPQWRPQSDYRNSYSARRQDGGVIRDLSHELDYAQLLAGPWRRAVAAGGHLSDLEIDSEDAVSLLLECTRCKLVSLHVNYLDRNPSRWILVNSPARTIRADLVGGLLAIDGNEELISFDRDETIRQQHLAAINGDERYLCSMDEAMNTMRLIDAAHESISAARWVAA